MKLFISVLLWVALLIVSWPLALLVLLCWPILWLLSIPFRLFGAVIEGALAFVRALLLLPSRVLGGGK